MRTASIHELKKEMSIKNAGELLEICLRLAKFKKENKELVTYLLFEAHDQVGFIEGVKAEVLELFEGLSGQDYLMKKGLRKILRITNKYIRYASSKEVEVELLLFFCTQIQDRRLPLHRSTQMKNIYDNQVKKVRQAVLGLHEDLQYDYLKSVLALGNGM